ncbi:MAG: HEPN domain-containing protein [Anaerolineales bacterium]|nr:HEPN domain-containing protein [Anaerolineales bacterium]
MSETPADQLIAFRLKQAHETLAEADALYQGSLWRGTINRAYYAMFYAVLALAVLRQQETSKHSGVVAFFDREFVKQGIFPRESSKVLHLAFDRRQANDYGEAFTVSQDEAKQALEDARGFVAAIRNFLDRNRLSP